MESNYGEVSSKKKDSDEMNSVWLNAVRRAHSFPKNSMRNVSHLLSGIPEFSQLLKQRRGRFFRRLLLHDNEVVRGVVDRLFRGHKSSFSKAVISDFGFGGGLFVNSLKLVRKTWPLCLGKLEVALVVDATLDDEQRASRGKELFESLYGSLSLPGFLCKELRWLFTSALSEL